MKFFFFITKNPCNKKENSFEKIFQKLLVTLEEKLLFFSYGITLAADSALFTISALVFYYLTASLSLS